MAGNDKKPSTTFGFTDQQIGDAGAGLSGLASQFDTPSSSSQDAATVELLPGLFGDTGQTGSDIGNFLKGKGENRFDQTIDPFVIPDRTPTFDFNNLIGNSAIGSQYQNELLNPTFGTSQAEQALLEQVISQFQGSTAMRNLNVTGGGFAQTVLPQLAKFRQDRLTNLKGGFDSELQAILEGRSQDVGERGADIGASTTTRGQDILGEQAIFDEGSNLLLALADLSRPTPVVKAGAKRSDGGGPSTTSQVLSGLGTAAMLYASDRRLKKNIINIKEYIKGINIYSFEYLWSAKKYIGFMADEVKKVIPSAVVRHESGFDQVNYSEVLRYGN
tara:strand:+ start:80 stop:1072 length:993 start_codon:yes stop_codon:yes gene_type:complete